VAGAESQALLTFSIGAETVGNQSTAGSLARAKRGVSMDFKQPEELLTPSEVAAMFRVNPKTVTRWARSGKISAIRTLGGHRRFRASEIRKFLEDVEEANDL
jgi:excisionase family DNA binding protein